MIFYSDKTAGASNLDGVVLVVDVDASASNVVINASIVRADGSKAVLKADTISDGAVPPVAGGLYTYTETDNGYKFKAVTEDIGDYTFTGAGLSLKDVDNGATASKKIGSIDDGSKSIGIADDAVIFLRDTTNKTGKTITGKQLKNLDYNAGYNVSAMFVGESNGLDRVVMAAVSAATMPTVGDVAENYGLVVSDSYKMNSDYITYQVWNGSEVVTVKEKDTTVSRAQMDVIAYSAIDADGVIKDVDNNVASAAYVHGLSSDEKTIWLNGQSDSANKYEINADTMIMYYDSTTDVAGDIGKAGGELKLADKVGNTYIQNVKYVDADGDMTLDFLLVEVKNNIGTTYTVQTSVTAGGNANVTGSLKAGTASSVKAGDSITYVISNADTSAAKVRVTIDGEQAVYVTVPAKSGSDNGTAEVTFRQPAKSNPVVKIDNEIVYSAISEWSTGVNGVTKATGAVASGTYYEGDTVTITVTTTGTATGEATITLTETVEDLAAVSPESGNGVTKGDDDFTLANGAVGQTFTFTVTAKWGETTPAISIA